MNPTLLTWLLDAGTVLGFALLALALAYGLLLLLMPSAALRLSAALNAERSIRRAMRPLEVPRYTERFFYRHHRALGILLLLGVAAFYFIYFFDFPRDSLLARVSADLGRPLADVLISSASRFLFFANALIAVFALLMLFRPSVLKPVETWANRWLSTRRAMRSAEAFHSEVDTWTERHPRIVGGLVLGGSLYILISWIIALG